MNRRSGMKIRWILVAVGFAALISVALSLRTSREVTTSSNQAYNYFRAGLENADRLYSVEALENFEAAVQLDSSFATAWSYLSIYYAKLGRKEECKIAAKRAYDLAQELPERERLSIFLRTAEYRGDRENIEIYLREMLEKYPDELEPIYMQASRNWKQGKLDEAINGFKRVLEINPNYALAYNNLGYLYAQLGDYDQAVVNLQKYAFIAPEQANPFDSLGEIYIMIGRYDEALEQFERALAVKPNFSIEPSMLGSAIYIHMARALWHQGKLQAAREYLQKASELSIWDWRHQEILIEEARIQHAQNQFTEAIATLNKALELYKNPVEINPRLALNYAELGNTVKIKQLIDENQIHLIKRVQKCLDDSTVSDEETITDHIETCEYCKTVERLGRYMDIFAKRASGDYAGALTRTMEILGEVKTSESKILLQHLIARTYYDMGEYEKALETLEPLTEINPNHYLFVLLTAKSLIKLGDYQLAEKKLQNFLYKYNDADPDWEPRLEAEKLLTQVQKTLF